MEFLRAFWKRMNRIVWNGESKCWRLWFIFISFQMKIEGEWCFQTIILFTSCKLSTKSWRMLYVNWFKRLFQRRHLDALVLFLVDACVLVHYRTWNRWFWGVLQPTCNSAQGICGRYCNWNTNAHNNFGRLYPSSWALTSKPSLWPKNGRCWALAQAQCKGAQYFLGANDILVQSRQNLYWVLLQILLQTQCFYLRSVHNHILMEIQLYM